MKYTFKKRILTIPDEEIDNYVNKLGISIQEAIEMWLDDNDYTSNEEAENLTQKAKENKITATIHQASGAAKDKKKPREDSEKEMIIQTVYECVQSIAETAQITNKTKVIEFDLNGNHYKLDLIKQRKKG